MAHQCRHTGLGVGATVLFAVVLTFAFVTSAHAWQVGKSTNGVVLDRESADSTVGATVILYYDYKGGTDWNQSYKPDQTSSFNSSVNYGQIMSAGTAGESLEIGLRDGYRCQAVLVSQSGVGQKMFAVLNEPLDTTVVNTSPIAVSTTGTSTVVVPDGMTVNAETVAGLNAEIVAVMGVALMLMCGVVVYKGVRR